MPKLRKAIRVFFNTYYDASKFVEAIGRITEGLGKLTVKRSNVVNELYYVEVLLDDSVDKSTAETLAEKINSTLRELSTTIFGVRVYVSGYEQ